MWTRQYKRRKTDRLYLPLLTLAVLGYFGFHAWHGEYGINSQYRLKEQAEQLQVRLEEAIRKREEVAKRTALLHDGTIEKDMLDEQVRRELGMARADEIIILTGSPEGIN